MRRVGGEKARDDLTSISHDRPPFGRERRATELTERPSRLRPFGGCRRRRAGELGGDRDSPSFANSAMTSARRSTCRFTSSSAETPDRRNRGSTPGSCSPAPPRTAQRRPPWRCRRRSRRRRAALVLAEGVFEAWLDGDGLSVEGLPANRTEEKSRRGRAPWSNWGGAFLVDYAHPRGPLRPGGRSGARAT